MIGLSIIHILLFNSLWFSLFSSYVYSLSFSIHAPVLVFIISFPVSFYSYIINKCSEFFYRWVCYVRDSFGNKLPSSVLYSLNQYIIRYNNSRTPRTPSPTNDLSMEESSSVPSSQQNQSEPTVVQETFQQQPLSFPPTQSHVPSYFGSFSTTLNPIPEESQFDTSMNDLFMHWWSRWFYCPLCPTTEFFLKQITDQKACTAHSLLNL